MKTIIKTIFQHLFVASTSIAALLHSMWTISHLLGGLPPADDQAAILKLGYWLPGLLVALSLDIGLLSTSAEIRQGIRNKTRYATLGVLSLSMFYLQSVYAILHFDILPLGNGIPVNAVTVFSAVRDYGVLIVPLLMPISILLYSFGHKKEQSAPVQTDDKSAPPPVQDDFSKWLKEVTPGDEPPLAWQPSANGHGKGAVHTADGA